jgi:Holliday junction resolvase RusA-like endonuclease
MAGYFFDVLPMGAPRQTKRDQWGTNKRPIIVKYHAYRDELRRQASKMSFTPPAAGCHFVFRMPVPKSYSKKLKASLLGGPHQEKPDFDNLVKAFLDALCESDSYVWDARVTKIYHEKPGIEVHIGSEPVLSEVYVG